MYTQARANQPRSHTAQPFFSKSGAPTGTPFFVQTQAAEQGPQGQEEETLQRTEASGLARETVPSPYSAPPENSAAPTPQTKLAMGTPGDRFEQEADRVADRIVQRVESGGLGRNHLPAVQAKCTACREGGEDLRRQVEPGNEDELLQAKAGTLPAVVPDSVQNGLAAGRGGGQALSPELRGEMEGAFQRDFSGVRIHTGGSAESLNRDLKARAFTYDRDIFFNAGEFSPNTRGGRHLLAHELTHTVQQRTGTTSMVQRDLKAYNTPQTDVLPSMGMGMSTSYVEMTAEAPGICAALSELIAAGKIKEVNSTNGNTSWFAAEHHKNAQLDEIQEALQKAGYTKAGALARAIYDIHGEFLYTNQELTTIAPFYSRTTSLGGKIKIQTNRSMTEWEIRQAKRVFGNAIKYPAVTIAESSISAKIITAGDYARTVGNTIYFPAGGSRNMAFMVHELTHVWQYQKTGWTYAPKAIWAQISEGYSYTESGKTAEQSLKDARVAGKTLYGYNKEQQGDILSDYYHRLQQGEDASAWQPFVDDIKNK